MLFSGSRMKRELKLFEINAATEVAVGGGAAYGEP
jgi:hypothetical protein